MSNQTEKDFYSPAEVADMLHVTVDQLRQMRWQGRIQGTNIGNSTVYTMDQIKAADLSPWPRGRKPKRLKKREDSGDNGDNLSVMLIGIGQAQLLSVA